MMQLVITFHEENGQVDVSGPIGNKMLSYGMLEMARDAIKKFSEDQAKSAIVPARMIPFAMGKPR
jgi:hypothetical protein